MSESPPHSTALLLAGGRATRMGGVDKGLVSLCGRPLAAHVLDALRAQADALLVNANRNAARYAELLAAAGLPAERAATAVLGDQLSDFQGPLAGMAAGLAHCRPGLLFTCPCDSPFVPTDMLARMRKALLAADAEIAVARDADYLQPVFSLLRSDLRDDLQAFLGGGERKIVRWFFRHRVVEVDFSDRPDAFVNINTEVERAAAEARLAATASGDAP